ncbi:hypothetical protein ACFLZP_00210 [Patescibacteria group bacterium]
MSDQLEAGPPGPEQGDGQPDLEAFGHLEERFNPNQLETEIFSDSPIVVARSVREVVLAYVADLLRQESLSRLNTYGLMRTTESIETRVALLRQGNIGVSAAQSLAILRAWGYTDEQLKARGFGRTRRLPVLDERSGLAKGYREIPVGDLTTERRGVLIATLDRAEDEINELSRFHDLATQLLKTVNSMEGEIGQFGNPRGEMPVSTLMLHVIGHMGPTIPAVEIETAEEKLVIPGEMPFGDKVTIALRAIREVGSGQALRQIGLPSPFSEEPRLGLRLDTVGYALRAVAGMERSQHLWEQSPRRECREPLRFLEIALTDALPTSLDNLSSRTTVRDWPDAERQQLMASLRALKHLTDQGKARGLSDKAIMREARQRGIKVPGIPDVIGMRYAILADPRLTDDYRSACLAYYLYRFLRIDVWDSVKPGAVKLVELGKGGEVERCKHELLTKYLEIPETRQVMIAGKLETVSNVLWHCENGPQAGDLVVGMWWLVRSVEEFFRKSPDDRSRKAGPVSLLGSWPNWIMRVSDGMIWTRGINRDAETAKLRRETIAQFSEGRRRQLEQQGKWEERVAEEIEKKRLPDQEQRLSLTQMLFDPEVTVIDENIGEERPFMLRDLNWLVHWTDEELWDKFRGCLEEEYDYLREKGIEIDREWAPGVNPREDFILINYLCRKYMLALFQFFIDPQTPKGYAGTFDAIKSREFHEKHKKKTELGVTLLLLQNGITDKAAVRAMIDLLWLQGCGAMVYECYKPGDVPREEDRFKEVERLKMPAGLSQGRRKMGTGDMSIDGDINAIFEKMVDARILPSADTLYGPELLKTQAHMFSFVAKSGRGLLPGDVKPLFRYWYMKLSDLELEKNEDVKKANVWVEQIMAQIKASHLYKPYDVIARKATAAAFAEKQYSYNNCVPSETRKRIG